jgi:hypothetical protein
LDADDLGGRDGRWHWHASPLPVRLAVSQSQNVARPEIHNGLDLARATPFSLYLPYRALTRALPTLHSSKLQSLHRAAKVNSSSHTPPSSRRCRVAAARHRPLAARCPRSITYVHHIPTQDAQARRNRHFGNGQCAADVVCVVRSSSVLRGRWRRTPARALAPSSWYMFQFGWRPSAPVVRES